ncbi:MAG: prepilin-type N-terminal cleavage/methylation domain-containing protein [Opitutae bacterium]|nr:prepilin-type N-terminal cleavage/methylation domain-containing protein [Opitutae bacterium]
MPRLQRGLSLVEVVIALTLFSLLLIGGLSALTTMHGTARRQGVYNSALALVESKQEWFRAQNYAPPAAPFLSTANTVTDTVPITLSEGGGSIVVNVTLTSTVSVVSSGHLVTVVATYTYQNKPVTITTQTVINEHSVANARLS